MFDDVTDGVTKIGTLFSRRNWHRDDSSVSPRDDTHIPADIHNTRDADSTNHDERPRSTIVFAEPESDVLCPGDCGNPCAPQKGNNYGSSDSDAESHRAESVLG